MTPHMESCVRRAHRHLQEARRSGDDRTSLDRHRRLAVKAATDALTEARRITGIAGDDSEASRKAWQAAERAGNHSAAAARLAVDAKERAIPFWPEEV